LIGDSEGIDCVLWDHDGVLVDTEPWFFQATQSTLGDYSIHVSREEWGRLQAAGQGLVRLVGSSAAAELDLVEVRRRRDELYADLLRENDVLIDGALEVLGRARERFRMALVTSSLRRFVDQLHGDTGLLDHFECIVTAEHCARHKPHPEPYLRALKGLGATADRTVAVEDSPRGLSSARAAGLRCFVIRSGFVADQEFAGAHAVLGDIRELESLLELGSRV